MLLPRNQICMARFASLTAATHQVEERSSARDDGGAKMSGLVYPDAEAAGTDCEDGGDAGEG